MLEGNGIYVSNICLVGNTNPFTNQYYFESKTINQSAQIQTQSITGFGIFMRALKKFSNTEFDLAGANNINVGLNGI